MTINDSLPLRILYTINAAPQYILAKSFSAYPVDLISLDDGATHLYASTALRHCLHTICRSSPELVQDTSRDFSLYVLDPLESRSAPAPVHISDSKNGDASTDNAPGVAVGLGLMSWALRDEEPITAVGTLVKISGVQHLEIVFALRETVSQKYSMWNTPTTISHHISQFVNMTKHPNSASTSSTTTSIVSTSVKHSSSHPPSSTQKPQRASRAEPKSRLRTKKPVPATGSDKLLDAADVYIGPQKKKGRPRTARLDAQDNKGKGKEVIVVDDQPIASTSALPPAPSSSQPTPPPVKSESQDESQMLQLMGLLSGSSPEKAALLATLNTIDSTSENGGANNPVLIAAITQLMAMYTKQQPPAPPPPPTPVAQPAAQDDDIVLLDKENVNPVVFNKKRRDVDAKLQAVNGPAASHSAPPSRTPSFTLRTRSNENTPPQPQPLARSNTDVTAENAPRKRTLSDFMEERDSNRSREKSLRTRDRERSEKREPSQRPTFLQPKVPVDAYRHYRVFDNGPPHSDNPMAHYRTPLDAWTSPVRSKEDKPDPYLADNESRGCETTVSRSPVRPAKAAASSPIRNNTSNNAEPAISRKKYIVPAWARTNTAMQPRLSKEAQRALKEAEERKRLERKENRRKSASAQERARRKKEIAATANSCPSAPASSTAGPSRATLMSAPVHPHTSPVRALLPVAAAHISPIAALFSSPRRRSPSPSARGFILPQTPTRPRKTGSLASGGMDDGSLFTPASMAGSIFGSAKTSSLFTPDPTCGPYGSPLNRKKMRTTPQTPLSGSPRKRLFDSMRPTSSSDPRDLDEVEQAVDVDLEKELEAAFGAEEEGEEERVNTPPSSLPVASSDTEVEEGAGTPAHCDADADMSLPPSSQGTNCSEATGDEGEFEEGDGETIRRPLQKEIWDGLPPSSPPPPSSPQLLSEQPSDTDMDDLELPVATSDMETDYTDAEGANMFSDTGVFQMTSEDESGNTTSTTAMANDEITAYFAMLGKEPLPPMPIMRSDDMFDQFTNLNAHSDGSSVYQPGAPFSEDGQHQGHSLLSMAPQEEGQGSDQTIMDFPLADADFATFWESQMQPLIQANMAQVGGSDGGGGLDLEALGLAGPAVGDGAAGSADTEAGAGGVFDFATAFQEGGTGMVLDHEGMYKDMKSLLGGCLV